MPFVALNYLKPVFPNLRLPSTVYAALKFFLLIRTLGNSNLGVSIYLKWN